MRITLHREVQSVCCVDRCREIDQFVEELRQDFIRLVNAISDV